MPAAPPVTKPASGTVAEDGVRPEATRNPLRGAARDVTPPRVRHKTRTTILCVCALLIAAEGAVRWRAWYRHGTAGPVADLFERDPVLGRRPRPGSSLSGKDRTLTVNRWGFRGGEIPKVKPDGLVRIAAVGGSTTFGVEASSDEAVWVAKTAALLTERAGAAEYDAINAGVPGYLLTSSIQHLEENVLEFDPDIVILYSVAVDLAAHARRQFPPHRSSARAETGLTALAYENSLLLNLIRVNTTTLRTTQLHQRRHDRLDRRGIDEYAGRLEKLIALCRKHDIDLVLCTCARAFGDEEAPSSQYDLAQSALAYNPTLSLAGLNDAYDRYNGTVRRMAETHGLPLVDLDLLLPKRGAYFADAIHFNDAGHGLAAQLIADLIAQRTDQPRLARGTD